MSDLGSVLNAVIQQVFIQHAVPTNTVKPLPSYSQADVSDVVDALIQSTEMVDAVDKVLKEMLEGAAA